MKTYQNIKNLSKITFFGQKLFDGKIKYSRTIRGHAIWLKAGGKCAAVICKGFVTFGGAARGVATPRRRRALVLVLRLWT